MKKKKLNQRFESDHNGNLDITGNTMKKRLVVEIPDSNENQLDPFNYQISLSTNNRLWANWDMDD